MTDVNTRTPPASARLDDLPGYGRGRAGQAQAFGHRLGSNEAPDAPSPAILNAAMAALAQGNRYPDLRGETLAGVLARRHGVEPDMVAVAAGSIVLLDQIIRAWCDPRDEVVAPWRSYEAYPIIVGLAGARLVQTPLDNEHRTDPAAICAAIGPRCRVVILCNPNNPTGTALDAGELDALIAALPADVLVVLDEAYADYADDAATVAASRANFLWLAVREQAVALTAHFSDAGVAVRCFANEGVRITTGDDADTAAVLAAAAAWRAIQERT